MRSPLVGAVVLPLLLLAFSMPIRSFGWQTISDDSQASHQEVRNALELAQGVPPCEVDTVSFTLLPGPRSCALPFEAYLTTTDPRGECPLSATALIICDKFEQNCDTCIQSTPTALGILFTCMPLNSAGVQIVTANFSFGTLPNQHLADSDTFICPPPPNCPANNIIVNPPAITCGEPFQTFVFEIVPLPACRLNSVSAIFETIPGLVFFGCDDATILRAVPKSIALSCSAPNFTSSSLVRMRSFWSYGNSSGQEQFLTGLDCPSPPAPPTAPPVVPTTPPTIPTAPPATLSPIACDSSTVEFNLLPGLRECGEGFQAILNTSVAVPGCPLLASNLTICDANRNNCVQCSSVETLPEGILFSCIPINANGFQVITASYTLGPLNGVISTADNFICPLGKGRAY
jgi:hypothetical protein